MTGVHQTRGASGSWLLVLTVVMENDRKRRQRGRRTNRDQIGLISSGGSAGVSARQGARHSGASQASMT
jgi:hypothetical protein